MGRVKAFFEDIIEGMSFDEAEYHFLNSKKKKKKKVIYKNKVKGENHGNGRIRNKSKSKRINK
tara:strand:- start:321 stop:509 length:189 start_codon:yes stop_codon:yes gene_type:complete